MDSSATNLNEPPLLDRFYSEVEQRFNSVDDPAHSWDHVRRVYKLALYLAEQEGADRFIVGLAALLHDLGRSVPETVHQQHHADLSVELAGKMMDAHAIPEETREAVLHAIAAHSFSRALEPRTLEARVVRDADRLDGIGAIGIMRWGITGAVQRTPRTRSYYPGDPFAERHTPNDKRYMLDHFFTKLLKLRDTMATETGRRLAGERAAFMQAFLDELRRELTLIDEVEQL
jgi:uncharacterized protein